MDFETYNALCYGIDDVEEPSEIPSYDPYEEEAYEVERYLDQEAYLEAQLQSWIRKEGY